MGDESRSHASSMTVLEWTDSLGGHNTRYFFGRYCEVKGRRFFATLQPAEQTTAISRYVHDTR
jgi:hypothetical protein